MNKIISNVKNLAKQEQTGLATITSSALLTTYAPNQAMRDFRSCSTVTKAMNSGAPKMGALVRHLGERVVEAYIKLWLIDLNNILDLKKPWKEHQIDDLAFRICDKYRSLNIADINLVFARAKNGEYSGIMDRLHTATVMKWFGNYYDERLTTASEQSYQDHVQAKTAFSGQQRSAERRMEFVVRAKANEDNSNNVKAAKNE